MYLLARSSSARVRHIADGRLACQEPEGPGFQSSLPRRLYLETPGLQERNLDRPIYLILPKLLVFRSERPCLLGACLNHQEHLTTVDDSRASRPAGPWGGVCSFLHTTTSQRPGSTKDEESIMSGTWHCHCSAGNAAELQLLFALYCLRTMFSSRHLLAWHFPNRTGAVVQRIQNAIQDEDFHRGYDCIGGSSSAARSPCQASLYRGFITFVSYTLTDLPASTRTASIFTIVPPDNVIHAGIPHLSL